VSLQLQALVRPFLSSLSFEVYGLGMHLIPGMIVCCATFGQQQSRRGEGRGMGSEGGETQVKGIRQLVLQELYMYCAVLEQKKATFSDQYAPQYTPQRDFQKPVYDPWYSRLFHRPAQCSPGAATHTSMSHHFPAFHRLMHL